MSWDKLGWDIMGWDTMRCGEMEWDGVGWDGCMGGVDMIRERKIQRYIHLYQVPGIHQE